MIILELIPVILLISFTSTSNQFDELKLQIQNNVVTIASAAAKIYSNKCQNEQFTCPYKSYNYCQGTAERECLMNFPSPSTCSNGVKYSLKSGIRIPNTITIYDMTDQVKYFLCKTAQPQFSNILENIIKENNNEHSWTFFGSKEGVLRKCPTKKALKDFDTISCSYYDNRLRPWYVQNVYKPKKMIILVQNSRRIHNQPNRYLSIQISVQALLKTASENDYFNIIQFSDSAQAMFSKEQLKLVSLKETMNIFYQNFSGNFFESIGNNISKSNTTEVNYHSALRLAMKILQNSKDEHEQYENLILMFAGFSPTIITSSTQMQLGQIIQQKSTQNDLNVIFFGFGVNLHNSEGIRILKKLSCQYNGIYFNLSDVIFQSVFLDQAKGFYEYLVQNNQNHEINWTKPYLDGLGLGRIITITKAAYYQEDNITYLIGVAGIDITIKQLEKFFSLSEIQDLFYKKQTNYVPFRVNISFCVLERLRGPHNCTNSCKKPKFCKQKIFPNNTQVFHKPIDSTESICCETIQQSNQGTFIVIIFIVIISLFFISIGIYCLIYRKLRSDQEKEKSYKRIFLKFNNFDQTRVQSESQISDINQ